MGNFTVRVKLSEAGGYNSIETGWAYLAARGNHGRDSRPGKPEWTPKAQWHLILQRK